MDNQTGPSTAAYSYPNRPQDKPGDGGPAFPHVVREQQWGDGTTREIITDGGMSLRDYFAAAALQGILACSVEYEGHKSHDTRVMLAYLYADKMLAERTK